MPESLGQYKILDRIGSGAMGELMRARDTRAGRTVALRLVARDISDDPGQRTEFLADARGVTGLSHPNVAALYEIGEEQGVLYLACEFVPGQPLASLVTGHPLNARRAVEFGVQLADALADAHAAGLVHRDLRSSGIMVTPKDKVKILDFGLARWSDSGLARARASRLEARTEPSELAAVRYMSPEQIVGEDSDERTDLFSLGVILFEMLTGRPPFTGANSSDVALQIAQAPTPSVRAINHDLPAEVEEIVRKALSKSLEQRYESAATMAAELRSVAAILDVRADVKAEAEEAGTLPSVSEGGSARGNSPLVWLAAGAVLVGLTWWQRDLAVTLLGRLLSLVSR